MNHDLSAARVDSLLNFVKNLFDSEQIGFVMSFWTPESAKFTLAATDVSIIDITVDDESRLGAEFGFTNFIGRFSKLDSVGVVEGV